MHNGFKSFSALCGGFRGEWSPLWIRLLKYNKAKSNQNPATGSTCAGRDGSQLMTHNQREAPASQRVRPLFGSYEMSVLYEEGRHVAIQFSCSF